MVKALKEETAILNKIPKKAMDYIKSAASKTEHLECFNTPSEAYYMNGDIYFGSFTFFFNEVYGQRVVLYYIMMDHDKGFGKGFDEEHRLVPYHLDS